MADNEEPLMQTPCEFGQFVLEKELGHGGMGGVYLGRDKMLDRAVAIKVMLKELGDDPTFLERFQREAQAAARLNHPNIAQIYSFGQEQGMPYIAMELVSGGSLDKMMEQNPGKLEAARVMLICKQMAEALALAADSGLVHGDVKPENILFDMAGNAKLVDFGLAAMQGDSDEIWGTPYYISPEKVRKQKIDFRADIYSLGGTIYHALTGVAPFEGEDATAVVKARFEHSPKPPSEVRPDLPKELDAIVMRMLELEAPMRYPTYQSLLGDVNRYLEKAGPVKTETTRTSRVKLKGKKPKLHLSADGATEAAAGEAEAAPAAPEFDAEGNVIETEEEGKKHIPVWAIIAMAVGGIIAVILLVVGILIWYSHSSAEAEKAEQYRLLMDKQRQARAAVSQTMKAAGDFARHFGELSDRSWGYMTNAVHELKTMTPKELLPMVSGFLEPEPAQCVADAIAYTNQIFVAAAAQEAAEANAKRAEAEAKAKAEAEAKADTNKTETASADTNKVAAANGATNAAPAKADAKASTNAVAKADANAKPAKDAKPAGTNAVAKADAKAAPSSAKVAEGKTAKKEEAKAAEDEEKPAAPETPALEIPAAMKDFTALWEDVWAARAANVRVQGRILLLLDQAKKKLAGFKGEDLETTQAIAAYSQKLVEMLDDVKGMKCVEQTQKKVNVIRSKTQSIVRTAGVQMKKAIAKAEKLAKEKAAAEAKAAKEAKEAEALKKLVEEETKKATAKYDSLASIIRHLGWDLAANQLRRAGADFQTDEGREEIKSCIAKVEAMGALQKHFVKFGKGFKFRSGKVIVKIDAKNGLSIKSPDVKDRKGKVKTQGKTENLSWEKFYQKQPGLMNQMIIKLVEKGRSSSTTKIGLKDWSNCMLGAALTMRTFFPDDPAIPKRTGDIVTKAKEEFEPCAKFADKWFPDAVSSAESDSSDEDGDKKKGKKKAADDEDDDDEE